MLHARDVCPIPPLHVTPTLSLPTFGVHSRLHSHVCFKILATTLCIGNRACGTKVVANATYKFGLKSNQMVDNLYKFHGRKSTLLMLYSAHMPSLD